MATLGTDGFDRYGGLCSVTALTTALLGQNGWATVVATGTIGGSSSQQIVAGLSSPGFAFQNTSSSSTSIAVATYGIQKTLPANYSRLIGGCRFSWNCPTLTDPTLVAAGIQLLDSALAQVSFGIKVSTGQLVVFSGGLTGTVLGTSVITVPQNSTHYLEWDITIHNTTGSVQIWLDGQSVLSVSGVNTRGGTSAAQANGVRLSCYSNAVAIVTGIYDDFYLFDTSGSRNNAVLLTNPRCEWQVPTSDVQKQWTTGAGVLGSVYARTTTTLSLAANQLLLRPFTPSVNCTLNNVSFVCTTTNVAAKFKGAVYADNGNTPVGGTRLGSGTEVVGCTANVAQTSPFASPVSLTAGTKYWLGFVSDTTLTFVCNDANADAVRCTVTYATAPPTPGPAIIASGIASVVVYGNVTGMSTNWSQVDDSGGSGESDPDINFSATLNQEDLFGFPALSVTPDNVYTMSVCGLIKRSDTGSRTVDLRAKSGSTTSSGSTTGISPGTTYGWSETRYETNPDTTAPWTGSEVNAASAGIKIVS